MGEKLKSEKIILGVDPGHLLRENICVDEVIIGERDINNAFHKADVL